MPFDLDAYLAGKQTPVFFGSAINNFGVQLLLRLLRRARAAAAAARDDDARSSSRTKSKFTGFVFKIQANMDPRHRDRIAFMRVCSGKLHARHEGCCTCALGKEVQLANALTFMASDREHRRRSVRRRHHRPAQPRHDHIGDTFTEGEALAFTGIPNFAPELFRRARAARSAAR